MLVQFTIPRGTDKLRQVIDVCVARCVERWGGCTVTDGIGYWRTPDVDVGPSLPCSPIIEPVAILGVDCAPPYDISRSDAATNSWRARVKEWFDNLAEYVRVQGNQHTVYYRMFEGGEARFVGPDTIIGPPPETQVAQLRSWGVSK